MSLLLSCMVSLTLIRLGGLCHWKLTSKSRAVSPIYVGSIFARVGGMVR